MISSCVLTSSRPLGQLRAPAGRELVLDYIIERKRMDDLCGSIIDGRFREQKNRTLICRSRELEGDVTSDEEERGIPSHSLISFAEFNHGAVKNKVISSRWCSQEGTMEVKSVLFFENAQILCLFPLCLQCQTVREVFARQLMQISGLSGDKAAAILGQYSTPYSLLAAYERCGSEAEKEKLLSCIRYGKLKRFASHHDSLILLKPSLRAERHKKLHFNIMNCLLMPS
ncbi:hypothetical protein GOODEAATRI_002750 [Goodea atripinnis]|uniref:Crossover junction endonuclease MUS81 n=1 Tax=Goodea atripinnis TaxID=208336 RepID=A0ABV0MRS4_9TELE